MAKMKTAERKPCKLARDLAKRIANALFVDGHAAQKATRLVIEYENGRTGGGWCKDAVIDHAGEIIQQEGDKYASRKKERA